MQVGEGRRYGGRIQGSSSIVELGHMSLNDRSLLLVCTGAEIWEPSFW